MEFTQALDKKKIVQICVDFVVHFWCLWLAFAFFLNILHDDITLNS